MENIGKDEFKLIREGICYVDVMSLRWCNKHLHSMPMSCFKDIFIKRLFPLIGLDPNIKIEDKFKDNDDYLDECDSIENKLYDHLYARVMNTNPKLINRMIQLRYNFC